VSEFPAAPGRPSPGTALADVTVVTAAYSMDRWDLTCRAIQSVLDQCPPPREIIVPVDHNPELLDRLRARWERSGDGTDPAIRIIPSHYDGHLGASATSAAEIARSPLLVFLDDDAAADPGWLERMTIPLADPGIRAVGGAPMPDYESQRPAWLPGEFNWVFGCAYVGLPTVPGPILHLIGTTMSVRTADIIDMGGIHSDNHPDMEMCHKLLQLHPGATLRYDPAATVRHFVPAGRVTWGYFWRRVFSVNRSKVRAIRDMGAAGHLRAERGFVTEVAPAAVAHGLRDAARGDLMGVIRAYVVIGGVVLAAAGYLTGTVEVLVNRLLRRPLRADGW